MKLLMAGLLCAGMFMSAFAAEQSDAKSWINSTLKGFKTKVSSALKSKSVDASAVAAVRGAKQDDASKTYWKGGTSEKASAKDETEKKELVAALELAQNGKKEESLKALDTFITAHPDSTYLQDAKTAKTKVSELPDAAKPAEKQDAKPADTKADVKADVKTDAKPAEEAKPATKESAQEKAKEPTK